MKILIVMIAGYFLPLGLIAQKVIGTYDYYDRTGKQFPEKMVLIQTKGYYRFCVPLNVREEFYDSIINSEKLKIRMIVRDSVPCAISYGDYIFTQKQNAVFIKIYDSLLNKTMMHRQYPLQTGDTTSYAELFTNHYEYPSQPGHAVYLYDSTILGAYRQLYPCYVIQEFASGGFDLRPSTQKVFLDKKSLLPIKIETYWSDSTAMEYYLFKANKSISPGK